MTTQNYLMIENNVVTNIIYWDGDSGWTPPANTTMLVQATTPAMVWELNADKTDFVLTEQIGAGSINFTWDGTAVITNEPKPPIPKPQPVTTGTATA